MTSSISSSRPGLPRAAIAAVLVVAVIELVVWRVPAVPRALGRFVGVAPETDPLRIRGLLERAPAGPPGEVVMLLGTSQAARGVDEQLVGGVELVNLAISGGTPTDYLWIAHRLDRSNADTVAVSFLETQMNEIPKREFTDATIAVAILSRFGWRMWTGDADPADLERARSNLRQGPIFSAVPTLQMRRSVPRAAYHWARAAAAQRSLSPAPPPRPDTPPQRTEMMAEALAAGPVRGSVDMWTELQWWAADRLFADLRARGFRVVYVQMPRHPDYERTVDPAALDHFRRSLRALCEAHGVEILAFPAADYTAADFYDFIHFTRAAGDRFSVELGRALQEVVRR